MSKKTISTGKMWLLGGAAALIAAAAPMAAQAAPYAFASNQISGLSITGNFTPGGTQETSATATAFFGGVIAPNSSTANGTVGLPLDINTAFIGGNAGTFGENNFTANGPAGFSGSRADASIGGGGAGTVTVRNVAETGGNLAGQATGQNTSTINITVLSGGGPLTLSLTDQIRLIASTAALQRRDRECDGLEHLRSARGHLAGQVQPDGFLWPGRRSIERRLHGRQSRPASRIPACRSRCR
jgi:hypothetical protein